MKVPFLELLPAYLELKPELDAAYQRIMGGGWYILGAEVEKFEEAFAAYCGVRHCVGVANGLEALQLALMAADVGPGDEVIVPAMTFIATWLAVSHVGATPVPVDVRQDTCNLDVARVEAAVSSRTKAVIPVHLYGQPADMDPVLEIASRHHLLVLEDAAQAHGASYNGQRTGSLGHMAGFSFYPGKNLGAFGDGGAVTTNDEDLYRRLLRLRNYGSDKKYIHENIGLNSRLDPLQAGFLSVKLKHLDEWNLRRKKIAEVYASQLKDRPGITLPVIADGTDPAWHLFNVATGDREGMRSYLMEMDIQTQIHYPIPPHLSEAYRPSGHKAGEFPVAETLASMELSLPIGPHLEQAQVDHIVQALQGGPGCPK